MPISALIEIKEAEKRALSRVKRAQTAAEKTRQGIPDEIALMEKERKKKTDQAIKRAVEKAREEGKTEAQAIKRKNSKELKALAGKYGKKTEKLAKKVAEEIVG